MSRFPTVIASLLAVACTTVISGCAGWNTNPFSNQELSIYSGRQPTRRAGPGLATHVPGGVMRGSVARPISTQFSPAYSTGSWSTTPSQPQVPFGNLVRGEDPRATGSFNSNVASRQDHWRLPVESSSQPVTGEQTAYQNLSVYTGSPPTFRDGLGLAATMPGGVIRNSVAPPMSTPYSPANSTGHAATAPVAMQVPFGNVIRGQDTATTGWFDSIVPGGQDYRRLPMQFSGQPVARGQNAYPSTLSSPLQANQGNPGTYSNNMFGEQVLDFGQNFDGPILNVAQTRLPTLDFDVYVDEARTGRFMFGMGVNSDLGVTGQVVIEERNFDFLRLPTSWNDIIQGGAFRGGGQNFRLEAMPGTQVQRYLASFTHPYIYLPGFVDPFSLNLSGFLFDRRYFDWTESRLGGRIGLGYRLTHDLSLAGSIRAESVDVNELRVVGLVPELDEVVGENELYSGRVTITHDTRDTPFAPTEGHLFEVSYEQVFGSFDYPRAEFDYRQYFLIRERPDGSGRHTLGYAFKAGFSGSQTPIFERFFAGGFSTMRGFDFRGASPVGAGNVTVGGDFRFLGSVEYIFPLTADDMMRGVVFCDYGTVEQDITINSDNYRVAPGAGLRISVPALGPAPLALDFAFPLAKAATDDTQVFSFFFGFGR